MSRFHTPAKLPSATEEGEWKQDEALGLLCLLLSCFVPGELKCELTPRSGVVPLKEHFWDSSAMSSSGVCLGGVVLLGVVSLGDVIGFFFLNFKQGEMQL